MGKRKKTIKQDGNNGPVRPLLELIEGSLDLMDAYITRDNKCEVIHDGQPTKVHIQGPPTYDDVLQTIEAADEYLRQLGAFVPDNMPKEKFEDLFRQYESRRLKCEEVFSTERR